MAKKDEPIVIEKSCLGVFNSDFNPEYLENYSEQVNDSLEVEKKVFTTDNYVIFGTPFSDRIINTSTVSHDNKIATILFSFED